MKSLLFGTAGIPTGTRKRNTLNGIVHVKELGLGCMELEFVRSVNIKTDKALLVEEQAKKHSVVLTCHAPYYINLNSANKSKLEASKKRILNSARIADMCGGYSVCFHPGFYMKQDSNKVYEKIKKHVKDIRKKLDDEGVKIWLRPETTGKHSAFGNLKESVKISKEIYGVLPCIDFAHLHARTNGGMNTYEEFCDILAQLEKACGKTALDNMHIHYSGIKYSEAGELHHLILKESDCNYKDLLKALRKFKCKGCVISESPNIEEDALLMQKEYMLKY